MLLVVVDCCGFRDVGANEGARIIFFVDVLVVIVVVVEVVAGGAFSGSTNRNMASSGTGSVGRSRSMTRSRSRGIRSIVEAVDLSLDHVLLRIA